MKKFSLLILLLVAFCACSTDIKLELIGQEEKIDSYLSSLVAKDSSVVIFRNNGSNRACLGFVMNKRIVTIDSLDADGTPVLDTYGRPVKTEKIEDIPIEDTVYIDYGDSIYIQYAGYVFTSSPSGIFSTNVAEIARQAGFDMSVTDTLPKGILFEKGVLIPGLEHGLHNAREQEHCIVVFSAEYGFGNTQMYNIPKMSALLYEVVINKVVKKEEQ